MRRYSGRSTAARPQRRAGPWVLLAICASICSGASAGDISVVKERFVQLLTQSVSVSSLKHGVEQDYLPKFDSETCLFSDIDYTSKRRASWPVMAHLGRMYDFALLAKLDSSLAHDLVPKTACGLDWWFRVRPTCPNWYDQQISGPNNIAQTLLLLPDGALLPNQTAAAKELIEEATWWKGWTGSNLLFMLRAQIMRGLFFGNDTAVAQGFQVGFGALQFHAQGSDGIQHDGSFHQHGPQLLAGSYGAEFTGHCLELFYLGQGTQWQAGNASLGVLSRLLIDGQQWMMTFNQSSDSDDRGAFFDWQVCGRSTTNAPGVSGATGFITPFLVDAIASNNASGRQADWQAFAKRLRGSVRSPPPLVGSQVYWDSDYVSHVRRGWQYTLHMESTRTIGGSCVNDQGKLARRMSHGAAALYYGGDEYKDTFPVWDYRRPPGVAGPVGDGFELSCSNAKTMGSSAVVGAATTGTGYTAAAMRFDDDKEMTGRRSWVMLDGTVVVMGSGLVTPAKGASVATTLDTTRLRGDVFAGQPASAPALGLGPGSPLPAGDHTLPGDTPWLLHGSTGYIFSAGAPGPGPFASLRVHNADSTGNWSDLGIGTGSVTLPVFDAWLQHNQSSSAPGSAGASFVYGIVPEVTSPSAMPDIARRFNGLTVLREGEPFATRELVADTAAGAMGAVLWEANGGSGGPGTPGFSPISAGVGWGVAASEQCLIAMHALPGGDVLLAVTTPGKADQAVSVYVDRAVSCAGCSKAATAWTRVDLKTAGGDELGRPSVVTLVPASRAVA